MKIVKTNVDFADTETTYTVNLPSLPTGGEYSSPLANSNFVDVEIENGVLSFKCNEGLLQSATYEIYVPVSESDNYKMYSIIVMVKVGICYHNNVTVTEAVNATCSHKGNLKFWHCLDCDCYWLEEELTNPVSYLECLVPINPNAHVYETDGFGNLIYHHEEGTNRHFIIFKEF